MRLGSLIMYDLSTLLTGRKTENISSAVTEVVEWRARPSTWPPRCLEVRRPIPAHTVQELPRDAVVPGLSKIRAMELSPPPVTGQHCWLNSPTLQNLCICTARFVVIRIA